MGLSTHVLDTMNGCPAAGMAVTLYTVSGDTAALVRNYTLNSDGRTDGPLYDNNTLKTGTYRLVFDVAAWAGPDAFFPEVTIAFTVSEERHHHVPLLLSPFGYSTYRGS